MKRVSELQCGVLGPDEARQMTVHSAVRCLRIPVSDPRVLAAVLRGEKRRWPRSLARVAAEHRDLLDLVANSGLAGLAESEVEGICSAVGLDEGRIENVDVIERQSEL